MSSRDLTSLSASELRNFLNSFDTVLCDCDGVLWNVGNSIPGVTAALQKFKQCGKTVGFVSNNNLYGTRGLYKTIKKYDNEVEMKDVVVPAQAIVAYFKSIHFEKEIFIFGSAAMKEEFEEAELKVANKKISTSGNINDLVKELKANNESIGAIVFDYDIFINYLNLVQAVIILKESNVIFVTGATDDKVYIDDNLVVPGPQSFLNALLSVCDRNPIQFGKPSENLAKFIKLKYNIQNTSRILFVGDSLTQDIEFGKACGFQTLLVLTGVSTLADVENSKNIKEVPNYYIDSLASVKEVIENKLSI